MKLRNVGRRYGRGGPWVLRGVDLELPAGGLVRIDGANGTGKSTLLRVLAGIDRPTEGQVADRPRTAFVPERFPAALPFTASDYLVRLGRIHGLRGTVARERAAGWLERFGAEAHDRTPMDELSKGTSQKVAVAQALLAEPELLVLDEAWTGLDVPARTELDLAVAERIEAGGTVVFVDHDPRRLAGALDELYTVVDGGLVRRTGALPDGAEAGPETRIVAVGPPGAEPPDGLPGVPAYETGPDGRLTLTAPAERSDALLRALLTARPPWHIEEVRAALPVVPAARAVLPEPAQGSAGPRADGRSPDDRSDGSDGSGRSASPTTTTRHLTS
ncbi:ATP-binding cassette domain-containing protein [Streptomyces sp. NRRL F-5135]|uniref:ATP-binding cassette domain-containing protein n=1 Tax=Streptomyces sp. NRRL F-5135 TaxID=1463858 RepID=UPI00099E0DA7|nr:ABC transporter ATP-binding protein [Streptomyces sp. NRRL F-5135]